MSRPFPGIDVPLLAKNPQTGQFTGFMSQTWIDYFQGKTNGAYIQSVLPAGSAVPLVSTVAKTVTSFVLPTGDHDVDCHVYFQPAATTSMTAIVASISLTNAIDTAPGAYAILPMAAVVSGGNVFNLSIPSTKFSGGQTIFLVAAAIFTVSTCSVYGIIQARRQD